MHHIGGTSWVPTCIGTAMKVKIPRESLMGFNHWHPISVTHVHWHSYLNRILTRDPAWQTNVGGGVFTRDLGTPTLAVENIRLLLYHCNALTAPFFTIARSRRPFANREKHDRPI